MDATYKAALQGPVFTSITLVSIALTSGTIYLSSGVDVTYDGHLWTGLHATWGALKTAGTFNDGADGQASRGEVVLHPPSMAAVTAFLAVCPQDTAVMIYQGAISPTTGLIIGAVELMLRGEFDVPRIPYSDATLELVLELGTEEMRLLDRNEERKLSNAFHQSAFPGELGFEKAVALNRKINWRVGDAASAAITMDLFRKGGLKGLKGLK